MGSGSYRNKKVLVLCPRGFGDVVMSLPMVECLVKESAEVHYLVKSAGHSSLVECLVPSTKIKFHFRNDRTIIFLLAHFFKNFRKFDLILPVSGMSYWSFAAFELFLFPGRRIRSVVKPILQDQSFYFGRKHKVEINLEILRAGTGLSADIANVVRHPKFSAKEFGPIVISPGSGVGEIHKRWPVERFVELCKLLAVGEQKVILIGSSDEFSNYECFELLAKRNSLIECKIGQTSIGELVDVIRSSRLLISNCNGPSHIGWWLGVPVLGLYGPTNPSVTGIYDYAGYVSAGLSCAPCYSRATVNGCGDPVCMSALTVGKVFEAYQLFTSALLKDLQSESVDETDRSKFRFRRYFSN